jgi:hypothetical protein
MNWPNSEKINPMTQVIDRSKYLNVSTNSDWNEILNNSLGFLRESWHSHWIGLDQVLEASIDKVLPVNHLSKNVLNLLNCARKISLKIEKKLGLSWEPSYHNRLHFADVITSLSILLLIEKERSERLDEYWTALLFLSAVCHDYMHPGGINNSTMEIENLTISYLKDTWNEWSVDEKSQLNMIYLIQNTAPEVVNQNHRLVENLEFKFDKLWATVILNEADILASCTFKYGADLSTQLAKEWRIKGIQKQADVATPQGRRSFLESARFSSTASQKLKIYNEIHKEIALLCL